MILAFQARQPVQELVAETLKTKDAPAERRVLLLETLAASRLARLPALWREALAMAIAAPELAVRRAAVQAAATLQAPELDDALSAIAENQKEFPALRLAAERAVVLRRPQVSPEVFALLLEQLDKQVEPLTRLEAAGVLGRASFSEMQLARLLPVVRGDPLISPSVLLPALQRAVTPETGPAFLDYLSISLKSGWRPSESELTKVLAALPREVQNEAESLRGQWRQSQAEQKTRLAEFEPLLQGGDASRGRTVFFSKKSVCATCHRIGNEGGSAGPDLTKIGVVRSSRDLLESLILPSSTIAQGFDPYLIVTKNGRSLTGVVAAQTGDVVVVRDASGAEARLPRDQIDEMRRSSVSLMPEGLERNLTREEFRDLLAFLQSLR
jgi:putative heme-binding domain-containing protein